MTGLERVVNALQHKESDRVPAGPLVCGANRRVLGVNYQDWATDSELAVLAFAYDSRTRGNAATEIVKYFLQMHYNLGVDLRRPDLLRRGNFYGGN
jgi:hypothetical protein